MAHCSLFSNHGNVLLVLAEDPDARLRDVAAQVGITERAVQKILRDLQEEGLLEVSKHGRRNRYRINARKPLRHPLGSSRTVGQLLKMMRDEPVQEPPAPSTEPKVPAPPVRPLRTPRPMGERTAEVNTVRGHGTGSVQPLEAEETDAAETVPSPPPEKPVRPEKVPSPPPEKASRPEKLPSDESAAQPAGPKNTESSAGGDEQAAKQGKTAKKEKPARSKSAKSSNDDQQGSLF